MRAKVKERRKERKSGSFPAEIAASFLKLLFRLLLFKIKQNCAAETTTSAGKGPDSRGRAHPLSVETVLELQDGSGVLQGPATPPPVAAP